MAGFNPVIFSDIERDEARRRQDALLRESLAAQDRSSGAMREGADVTLPAAIAAGRRSITQQAGRGMHAALGATGGMPLGGGAAALMGQQAMDVGVGMGEFETQAALQRIAAQAQAGQAERQSAEYAYSNDPFAVAQIKGRQAMNDIQAMMANVKDPGDRRFYLEQMKQSADPEFAAFYDAAIAREEAAGKPRPGRRFMQAMGGLANIAGNFVLPG